MTYTTQYTVTIPRLIGSRERVIELLDHLPNDLSNSVVTVNTLENMSMAQCAVDEICRQLAVNRHADIVLIATNEKLITRAKRSVELREVEQKLKIVKEKP